MNTTCYTLLARIVLLLSLCAAFSGCLAPNERLTFPDKPLRQLRDAVWYDVNHNSAADFVVVYGDARQGCTLAYDDDEDGQIDRTYRLNDFANADVPHLIILLDSIPYQAVADRYNTGEWPWFDPPQKVIPPFPTMSGLIFTSILHAPPLPGMINRYFDRARNETDNLIIKRAFGRENPWQQRLHYHAKYTDNGRAFLKPRPWYQAELARVKKGMDESSDRVTVVYIASTACMLSRYGADGLKESLDGLSQICLQLLYERQGAIKISIMADHGHNLIPGHRISLEDTLKAAGFNPAKRLNSVNDVVIENDGMVNYIGIHTKQAAKVALAVLARHEVQLTMYVEGAHVIVRDHQGAASIEYRNQRYKYTPLDHDVLQYQPVMNQLAAAGKVDADGYVADRDWFDATVDHEWPDAPRRLWDAFHGMAINTPDLMLTLNDGYCTGLGWFELFISMASTHGGFNQVNSATFIMTMTGRATKPMRSGEVLETIQPGIFQMLPSTRPQK